MSTTGKPLNNLYPQPGNPRAPLESNDDADFKHLPARNAGETGLEGDVAMENTPAGRGGEGGAGASGPAAPLGLEEDGLRQRREVGEADSREEETPRVRGRETEEERNARQQEKRATLRFFCFSLHTHTPVHTQHAYFANTLPARAQTFPHAQHINTWCRTPQEAIVKYVQK